MKKFSRHLYISREKVDALKVSSIPLDYEKWVAIIDSNEKFIWAENTESGKHTLNHIEEVPESFRQRVLSSFRKLTCFSDPDNENNYRINLSFQEEQNRIAINFESHPKIDDLRLLKKIADELDALLLNDGLHIIQNEHLKD